MLEQQMWFRYEEALPIAYRQCLDEGKDVEADYKRMKEIAGMAYGDPEKKKSASVLLERWESLPVRADFPYEEPDGLDEIEYLTAAFDTDCNCATAGSVLGMILGADNIPNGWIAPLRDQIRSGVDGLGLVSLSSLASRTIEVYRKYHEK